MEYFSLLCCIYEIFFRRRFLAGLLYGALAVCVGYILGVLILQVSPIDVYSELLPFSWKIFLILGLRMSQSRINTFFPV